MKKLVQIFFIFLLVVVSFSSVLGQISVTIPDTVLETGSTALIPVNVDEITELDRQVWSFEFTIQYDENVLNISGVEFAGTISESWESWADSAGLIVINLEEDGEFGFGVGGIFNNILGKGALIYLQVEIVGEHADSSILELQDFLFNAGDPQSVTVDGKVSVVAPLVSVSFISSIENQGNIIIDGQEKAVPFDTTWHSGLEHTIGVTTPQDITEGSRLVFDNWSDAGDTIHVVAAVSDTIFQCIMNWEHLLTLFSEYGAVQGTGWYAQGDTVEISVDSLITFGDTTRYAFSGWGGSGQGSYSGDNFTAKVIVNEPIFEEAQWTTQHFVRLESLYGNPVGQGWYAQGDTVEIQIDSLEYLNDQTRFLFNSWEGTGDGSYSGTSLKANIIVNSPIVENAFWDKQFYLSVTATPENIVEFDETGWYTENVPGVEILAPETVEQTDVKYRFAKWLIDGEINELNPIPVQIDTSHILNAVYQVDSVLVEITTDAGDGFLIYVDDVNYSTPYAQFWEYQSEHVVGIDSVIAAKDSLSRYVFDLWDDGGDLFHSVKADSAKKLVAALIPQHYLLVETKPAGLIEFEETGWYVEGDSVQLTEAFEQIFTETGTFQFNTWIVDSIPVAGNPINVNMNTFHHVVANYENLYFIAGKITDSRGLPVAGAEFILTGTNEDTVYSSETGDYFFSLLSQGNYQVIPHFENFKVTPSFREYSPLQSSQTAQDFLAIDTIEPNVQLLYPNGGQWLKKSTIDTIKWTAYDNVGIDSIAIQLAVDGGINWQAIAEFDSGNIQQYTWLVPDTVSKECLVRVFVFDYDNNTTWDESDSTFTIGSIVEVADQNTPDLVPTDFVVEQNYPNPFNNSTIILFQLPKESHVTVEIYNLSGQKVQTLAMKNYKAGHHRITWNGKDKFGRSVSSGVYLYRVEALENVVFKKLLYVR
ncbi:T9SS type A sorting domain-containing protein [candidate division KSB1 bacterium]|nr:T9SS type A sorting domain-containing protein [candidate division KSB1 bacterium]MBL7094325.1 T9SS type A sorting domain-containing protein [candidate division KSB1 bacterium]